MTSKLQRAPPPSWFSIRVVDDIFHSITTSWDIWNELWTGGSERNHFCELLFNDTDIKAVKRHLNHPACWDKGVVQAFMLSHTRANTEFFSFSLTRFPLWYEVQRYNRGALLRRLLRTVWEALPQCHPHHQDNNKPHFQAQTFTPCWQSLPNLHLCAGRTDLYDTKAVFVLFKCAQEKKPLIQCLFAKLLIKINILQPVKT